jgi:hypothetical protein
LISRPSQALGGAIPERMDLDLTDETAALERELRRIITDDRYRLSAR